jgi:hypothetical protein
MTYEETNLMRGGSEIREPVVVGTIQEIIKLLQDNFKDLSSQDRKDVLGAVFAD